MHSYFSKERTYKEESDTQLGVGRMTDPFMTNFEKYDKPSVETQEYEMIK